MSVRSRNLRSTHESREEARIRREERIEKRRGLTPTQQARQERIEKEHPKSPLNMIKSMVRPIKKMFNPRTERPIEKEEENPDKQPTHIYTPPQRTPPGKYQKPTKQPDFKKRAIGVIRKFGQNFAEGGKEVIKDIRKRQDQEGGRDAAIGDFIGAKGSGASRNIRINEHGYVEMRGADGKWIFTGKKARIKVPKTGYDEATGLEFETEQDEEGGKDEGEGLYNFEKSEKPTRDRTRGSRRHRDLVTLSQGGIPTVPSQQAAAPAWHTGVSGMSGMHIQPSQEQESIIGSGLDVMSTGMFRVNQGTPRLQQPIGGGVLPRPRQEQRAASPGAGLNVMSSGTFPMTYESLQQTPPQSPPVQEVLDVELPPVKLSKKRRKQLEREMKAKQQRQQVPSPPPANSRPSFSAFNEVFGDRVQF